MQARCSGDLCLGVAELLAGLENGCITAHDYLYAGVQRRLGRPLSPAQWEQIWQGYPQQGRVSDWVKQTKRVLAGR